MGQTIERYQYRGQLKTGYLSEQVNSVLQLSIERIKALIKQEKIMTAALYYYGDMLFLYYETIEEGIKEKEPSIKPEELVGELSPYLEMWPGVEGKRLWVHMPTVYYHAIPESVEDWSRPMIPELRRGRIAFLYEDSLFEYVYHHVAIVNEGLLP